jgi:hypothetical protein
MKLSKVKGARGNRIETQTKEGREKTATRKERWRKSNTQNK